MRDLPKKFYPHSIVVGGRVITNVKVDEASAVAQDRAGSVILGSRYSTFVVYISAKHSKVDGVPITRDVIQENDFVEYVGREWSVLAISVETDPISDKLHHLEVSLC